MSKNSTAESTQLIIKIKPSSSYSSYRLLLYYEFNSLCSSQLSQQLQTSVKRKSGMEFNNKNTRTANTVSQ